MFANFTVAVWVHTILSIVALIAGIFVMRMLLDNRKPDGWTLVFFLTAIATSVTGFFLPASMFLPSHGVGVICLVFFVPALLAQYVYNYRGAWRWIYAVSMAINVYFLFFVLIAQAFAKVPALHALAPTQSEPPFGIAQGILFVVFAWLVWRSIRNFHGPAAAPA